MKDQLGVHMGLKYRHLMKCMAMAMAKDVDKIALLAYM